MLRVRDKNVSFPNVFVRYIYFLVLYSFLFQNDDSTYGFETPSRQACKHLWKCCVEHHAFFRLVQVSLKRPSSHSQDFEVEMRDFHEPDTGYVGT